MRPMRFSVIFSSFMDFWFIVKTQHQLSATAGLALEFLYRVFSDFFIGINNIITGTSSKPPWGRYFPLWKISLHFPEEHHHSSANYSSSSEMATFMSSTILFQMPRVNEYKIPVSSSGREESLIQVGIY